MRRSSIAIPLVLAAAAATGAASASPKIDNILERPLAASEAQFVEAAMVQPAKGACEVLSPDRAFRDEMLLDVSTIGAPGGRKYERRVALVVGNGAYTAVSALPNPPNDATSMARMFRALGFTVYRAIDATEAALDNCFTRFKSDLQKPDAQGRMADIALFFYAGHGLQLTGAADNEKRNYMMSVDASVDPATGKAKGFRQIDRVLTEMRAHSKQAVFLYDACRNAPYKEGTVKEADGQAVRAADASVGPAPVAEEGERASEAGLFIAYATSPGKTADDDWGPAGSRHSPFTEALLKRLPTPGLAIGEAFDGAFYDVGELTDGRQTPWTSSSLQQRLRLNGLAEKAEIQVRSNEWAGGAAGLREQGLKGAAIAAALKGQPRTWDKAGIAEVFEEARTELFLAHEEREVQFLVSEWGVDSAAFSPDGALVVTIFAPKGSSTWAIWDAKTGDRQSTMYLSDLDLELGDAEFSPDGARLLAGTDDGAKILDARTGEVIRTFGPGENIILARFSADGRRIVTGSSDGIAKIWDANNSELIRTFVGHGAGVSSADFSPDGARVVTGALDRTARIWDVSTGEPIRVLEGHLKGEATAGTATGVSAAFSPNGARIVTGAYDGTAKIWDAETGALLRTLGGHRESITSATFSPDGARVVTGAHDDTAKIWDAETGALLRTLEGHSAGVISAGFSPDGTLVLTGSLDGTARIWDVGTAPLIRALTVSDEGITQARFSSDGARVITAGYDETAKIWDLRTGALVRSLDHGEFVTSAALSSDGARVVTASSVGKAKLWTAKTGMLARTIAGHLGEISDVNFSPDGGRVLTGSADKTANIWDAKTGALIRTLVDGGNVSFAAFSSDGASILTGSKVAKIWDAKTGELTRTLEGPDDLVHWGQTAGASSMRRRA